MRYFRTRFGTIINEENVTIPMDENSQLYVDYFAFLSNNGVVEDTDFVTEEDRLNSQNVPEKVTRRQLRQALILLDFDLSIIDKKISKIEDIKERLLMESFWLDSTEFERYHERLISFATDLGFTEGQTDNLFILADTL